MQISRLGSISKDLEVMIAKYSEKKARNLAFILLKKGLSNIDNMDEYLKEIERCVNRKSFDNLNNIDAMIKLSDNYDQVYFEESEINVKKADEYFKKARLVSAISFLINKTNPIYYEEFLYELSFVFATTNDYFKIIKEEDSKYKET